jgi:hypothetical protein
MVRLCRADRRNGYYPRHLLTDFGDIELAVPQTPCFAPTGVVWADARRPAQVERMMRSCFVLGLSMRSAGRCRAAKAHRRRRASPPRSGRVRAQARRSNRVIDFPLAAFEWERVMGDLIHRRLTRDPLEMICVAYRLRQRAGPALLGAQDLQPARAERRSDELRKDELYLADIGGETGAATHAALDGAPRRSRQCSNCAWLALHDAGPFRYRYLSILGRENDNRGRHF